MATDADMPLRRGEGLEAFEQVVDIDPADPLQYETWKMVQAYGRGGSYSNPRVDRDALYPSAAVDADHEVKDAFRDEATRQLSEFYAAQLATVTGEQLPVIEGASVQQGAADEPLYPEQAEQVSQVTADYLAEDPVVQELAQETADSMFPRDDMALQLRDAHEDFGIQYLAPR